MAGELWVYGAFGVYCLVCSAFGLLTLASKRIQWDAEGADKAPHIFRRLLGNVGLV